MRWDYKAGVEWHRQDRSTGTGIDSRDTQKSDRDRSLFCVFSYSGTAGMPRGTIRPASAGFRLDGHEMPSVP